MRTSQKHIFAVGDVNGLHEVVHIAIQQGEIAGFNACSPNHSKEIDDRLKASVVFTDPAVASVGLSEKECKAANIDYLVASHPFSDHGKSMCLGETHGHVKILCNPTTGEVIGRAYRWTRGWRIDSRDYYSHAFPRNSKGLDKHSTLSSYPCGDPDLSRRRAGWKK